MKPWILDLLKGGAEARGAGPVTWPDVAVIETLVNVAAVLCLGYLVWDVFRGRR